MNNDKLAQLLFPHINKSAEEYMQQTYPKRTLPEGAYVTRFAPSPTGFIHIGGLFTALVNERLAHQSGGVVFLRIEDTDKKREQEGGIREIVSGLSAFDIQFDEGTDKSGKEIGTYGPYTQSARAEIYQAFCCDLVKKGLAYPCFCTEEKLSEIRQKQEAEKVLPGYHTEYAVCAGLTYEQVEQNINDGKPYVMRLRSPGKIGGRIKYKDIIKGEIEMDENITDIVLLKSDGIPTYHFAHAVDDTLMGTTHVIRSDEWVPSVNIHLQLFYCLGIKAPKFAHVSPIMKEENGGKRKLSKRKDPEAAVSYFTEQGYTKEAVIEYLLTLANSSYEDWRKQNRRADYHEYKFMLGNMSKSGALFDMAKLSDVSSQVISLFSAQKIYDEVLAWSKLHSTNFAVKLEQDPARAKAFFSIDRAGDKPRKDIRKWSDTPEYMSYIYPGDFAYEEIENVTQSNQLAIVETYMRVFDTTDDKDMWFEKLRGMCIPLGFSPDVKAYKAQPEAFSGHIGDVTSVVRVAITGKKNTPDLYSIMNILGYDEIKKRLCDYVDGLKKAEMK